MGNQIRSDVRLNEGQWNKLRLLGGIKFVRVALGSGPIPPEMVLVPSAEWAERCASKAAGRAFKFTVRLSPVDYLTYADRGGSSWLCKLLDDCEVAPSSFAKEDLVHEALASPGSPYQSFINASPIQARDFTPSVGADPGSQPLPTFSSAIRSASGEPVEWFDTAPYYVTPDYARREVESMSAKKVGVAIAIAIALAVAACIAYAFGHSHARHPQRVAVAGRADAKD